MPRVPKETASPSGRSFHRGIQGLGSRADTYSDKDAQSQAALSLGSALSIVGRGSARNPGPLNRALASHGHVL